MPGGARKKRERDDLYRIVGPERVRTTIRPERPLHDWLEKECKREQVSLNRYILEALRKMKASQEKKAGRKKEKAS